MKYHGIARNRIGEREATNRAIAFSELVDVPILIAHVSTREAMEEIREAQMALGTLAGMYAAPEGGATYAALKKLGASGFVKSDDLVVLFQTGMGLKYDPPIS